MASPAALDRRRREMAAAYVKAARRHAPRAALARKLVRATCDVLAAEIRAEKTHTRSQSTSTRAPAMPDLFGEREPAHGAAG